MEIKCELFNGVSKKTGNPYTALDIVLCPGYKKRVFLTSAELALVQIANNNK